MKELKGTEDFLRINQNVNIFDIVSCKEEQASQIIAWLLNPREAHGFGDKFFRAMLDAVSQNSQILGYTYSEEKPEEKPEETKERLQNAYKDVIIQTEYCIDISNSIIQDMKKKIKLCKNKIKSVSKEQDKKKINKEIEAYQNQIEVIKNKKCQKNGRVDVLLCFDKYIFVIENKYGSKEHGNQARYYFEHFSNKAYKGYTIFYIYLDFNTYYDDDNFQFSDENHKNYWHFINYDWIVEFLRENLTGSYVDKILQDIYIEFSENYEDEPYFKKFYNQAIRLYNDYKEDINAYNDPYPYKPNSKKNLRFALYNGFYSTLSGYSNWDKLKFDEKIYCTDSSRTNDISITLKSVDDEYDERNRTLTEKKKWWPFWINLALHKPKDEDNKKRNQYMEIKLICTNEYITEDNYENIQEKLKKEFTEAKVQNKITEKIKPFNNTISMPFLKKDIVKDFDFSDEKIKEVNLKISSEYHKKLENMYDIFFSCESKK